tara:strand:+ start:339 stop:623 length:285 start_codon:yes stop_codon:yes gene_type:complete
MKEFDKFIEEAATKRCPPGKYYCHTDKKCKKIPQGYHVGRGGYIEPDEGENGKKNGKNGNGNGNGNGGSTNSNGGANGGGNGGGNGSGGGGNGG